MNTFTFPPHSGLNADWSVCAWQLAHADENGFELWLLENEEGGGFETVLRRWDDEDGSAEVELLSSGLTMDDAKRLLTDFRKCFAK
jgi:hypothetical protein